VGWACEPEFGPVGREVTAILRLGAALETVSPVRDRHPDLT
jgi:hypothetical protein